MTDAVQEQIRLRAAGRISAVCAVSDHKRCKGEHRTMRGTWQVLPCECKCHKVAA